MGNQVSLSNYLATTQYVNENFNTFAKDRIAEDIGMQEIFGVKNVDFQTEVVQKYAGVKGIQAIPEGADLPSISGQQGDQITFTQAQYGVKIPVTKPMRIFDRYDEVQQLVKTATDDAFDKIDTSFSDVLLNGWSTSYTNVYNQTVASVGPDGKALFASNHSSAANASYSFNNIIADSAGTTNPALSRDAVIKTRSKALKYRDEAGINRPVKLDTIVVGPDLEDLARRIVESEGIVGTANRETNVYLKGMNVVVWSRLGATGQGTDTSAYWFMIDSKKIKEGLRAYFKQKPMIAPPAVYGPNMIWNYELDYFYSYGWIHPIYIYGSKGDNS